MSPPSTPIIKPDVLRPGNVEILGSAAIYTTTAMHYMSTPPAPPGPFPHSPAPFRLSLPNCTAPVVRYAHPTLLFFLSFLFCFLAFFHTYFIHEFLIFSRRFLFVFSRFLIRISFMYFFSFLVRVCVCVCFFFVSCVFSYKYVFHSTFSYFSRFCCCYICFSCVFSFFHVYFFHVFPFFLAFLFYMFQVGRPSVFGRGGAFADPPCRRPSLHSRLPGPFQVGFLAVYGGSLIPGYLVAW